MYFSLKTAPQPNFNIITLKLNQKMNSQPHPEPQKSIKQHPPKKKQIRKRRKLYNLKKYQNKLKLPTKSIQCRKIIDEKLCENCKKCDHDEQFIFCDECDDGYHGFCLDPPLMAVPEGQWLCPKCEILEDQLKMENQRNEEICEPEFCCKCMKKLDIPKTLEYQDEQGNLQQQILSQNKIMCLYCKNWFHEQCFSPRTNSLNCYECQMFLRRSCPKSHLQFINFIKKQTQLVKKSGYYQLYDQPIKKMEMEMQMEVNQNRRRKKNSHSNMQLKIFNQPTHWEAIARYQASLYYALKTKRLVFCDEQLYKSQQLLQKNNSEKDILEVKPLHDIDAGTYQFFKWKIDKGAVGSYQIKQDRIKGFYVQATSSIQKGTIICQYAGEVSSHRQSLKQINNDSIFTLLISGSSSDDLNIMPNKFGNMSRFICGVNNSDREQSRLVNVQALKFSHRGRIRIVFTAKKNIEIGDTLYLNYNAGTYEEYPTGHFVT